MSASPIAIARLDHHFGRGALRRQTLFDVTVDIPEGEIVIVTGPSGSGKTTLLTIVGALRSAQSGSVRVLGEELSGARPRALERVRRRIGFIFQQHNLVASLSALQNVELGLRLGGTRWRSVRRNAQGVLESVGLGARLHYKPAQLSGGQRQRVAIARALAHQPPILLADEPTASLDKQSGREVVTRMEALARESGTTILLVTHDNRILDVADRILHLEDGRLATFTQAVIANTRHMMRTLAESTHKQHLAERIQSLDAAAFADFLGSLALESESFLELTSRARDEAFQSMLDELLRALTHRLGVLLRADRASLFLVDRAARTLVLQVSQDDPAGSTGLRIPIGTGIAGTVAATGAPVNVPDAYADPRFNPEIDRVTGYRTRSILCLPIRDRTGEVFAIAQLLNRADGAPFDVDDEKRFGEFIASIGLILETLARTRSA